MYVSMSVRAHTSPTPQEDILLGFKYLLLIMNRIVFEHN